MKQFLIFAGKEFRHIFRDRRTMLILLVMPVVQIILFGFAITTEVQNVRMAVLDPSDDVLTRRIVERLDASEYFTLTARFHTPQEMDEAFRRSQVDMAVVFSPGFADGVYTGDAAVQLVCDATDPNTATMQTSYATGIITAATGELLPAGVRAPQLRPEVKLLYNPQMKSVYNFVPGVMGLILMLICAMMTSVSIVRGPSSSSCPRPCPTSCFRSSISRPFSCCPSTCSTCPWRAACRGSWPCRCFSSSCRSRWVCSSPL